MTTFPFDRRKPIIVDPAARATRLGLLSPDPAASAAIVFAPDQRDATRFGPILFSHRTALLALPTQPVGDPVPRPNTPQPMTPREPEDPVQAPHPREPELPAIDPHEPGLPDTRIGLHDGACIGDPPRASRVQWLV